MRKIEEQMIQAIKERKDFSKSNTKVIVYKNTAKVFLHGNLIAVYSYRSNKTMYSSAGWQTNTTKSRLNALGGNICQRNFTWLDAATGEIFKGHTEKELIDFLENEEYNN